MWDRITWLFLCPYCSQYPLFLCIQPLWCSQMAKGLTQVMTGTTSGLWSPAITSQTYLCSFLLVCQVRELPSMHVWPLIERCALFEFVARCALCKVFVHVVMECALHEVVIECVLLHIVIVWINFFSTAQSYILSSVRSFYESLLPAAAVTVMLCSFILGVWAHTLVAHLWKLKLYVLRWWGLPLSSLNTTTA